jgi:hypothetical protein
MSDETDTQNQNPDTQTTDKPADKAADDLDARVNRVVTARLKRETERLQKEYDRKIADAIAAIQSAQPTSSSGSAAIPADVDAKLKQHEAALAKLRELEEERAKERAQAQAAEERATITEALTQAGAVNIKGAIALLKADGRIVRDEKGQLVYRDEYEDVPVAEGVKRWLATEEGRFYQAPRNAAGSGGSDSKVNGTSSKLTPEEALRRLASW